MKENLSDWLRRAGRKFRQTFYPIPFLARRFLHDAGHVVASAAADGICVDIGAGSAPYRRTVEDAFGIKHYVVMDIAACDATTVIGSATAIPLADDCAQLVVAMELIQHIDDVHMAFDEISRILAPGGCLVLSYPFSYGECDHLDFRRWSLTGMEWELTQRGLVVVHHTQRGGFFFALACMFNWVVQHAIPGGRLGWRSTAGVFGGVRGGLILLLTLPTILLEWLALMIDILLPASGIYMGAIVLAQRPLKAIKP